MIFVMEYCIIYKQPRIQIVICACLRLHVCNTFSCFAACRKEDVEHSLMLKEPTTTLRSYHGLLLALILWLFSGLIFLPLSDAGIFGSQLSIGPTSTTLSLALVGAIFGLLFVPIFNWLAVRPTVDTPDK